MVKLCFFWGLFGIGHWIPFSSFGQVNTSVDIEKTAFISNDTLNILITLMAKNPINYPSNCVLYDSDIDIYPMFICYELEEFRKGKYCKLGNNSYNLNSPLLFLTDSITGVLFKCDKLISSYKFIKDRRYRIRYYIHFERFNPDFSLVVTEWSDLKFKNP